MLHQINQNTGEEILKQQMNKQKKDDKLTANIKEKNFPNSNIISGLFPKLHWINRSTSENFLHEKK